MALIVLALIVAGIAYVTYGMARKLWNEPMEPRTAMMYAYVAGFLDCIAVLLMGFIFGSLL